MLSFIIVVLFSAEVHKFEYKSCFVHYHFYSKIGKNTGTHGKSKDTGSFQLKLREITPNMLF